MPADTERFAYRRNTTAQWASFDPILKNGEPGWDTVLLQRKVGDGVHRWSELPWDLGTGGGGGGSGQPLQLVAASVSVSGVAVMNKHNPVSASGAARSISLPTGQAAGTQVSVEKTDASTNTVSITGNIRGVGGSTIALAYQAESLMLRADSSGSWWPIAGHRTKTSLDLAYVTTGGVPFHIDTTRPVNAAIRVKREPLITMTQTGDLTVTLGATPLGIDVWVKTTSGATPALLFPGSYTLVGNVLTVPSLAAGNIVYIKYEYDSDVTASPGTAQTNVAAVFDDFNRTTTAGSSGSSAIGAAITGQVPTIWNAGSWGLNGTRLWKSAVGTNAGAGDGVTWASTSENGWFETVFAAGNGGSSGIPLTGAGGLTLRSTNSTQRFQLTASAFQCRGHVTSSVNVTLATFTQTFLPGDGQGVLALDDTYWVYRRVNNAGPWVLVCGPIVDNHWRGILNHGIRSGDAVADVTEYEYFKHLPSLTAAPVAT